MNPVLYVSVELKARDLDPRLLIAAEALKQGLHVIFGQQWALSKNIFSVPNGAFLFKTVNEIQATQMLDARAAGHIVVATDEEVLACGCDACFESGMGPTAAANLDLFFAQSDAHAAIVARQHAGITDALRITGNPRVDLLSAWGRLSYKSESNEIRQRFGRFVLFNTNFGWINSIWNARENAAEIAIRTGHLDPENPESVTAYESELAWERDNMAAMEQVINWLADNRPDIAAVVRPHPAEDESYWQTKYQDADSVHVVTGTGHIPWTMAAEVLVHTTCSTGMEAAILGTPALSVTPHTQAAQHHYIISNQVNPSVETGDQASAALSAFLDDRSGPISHSEELAGRLSDQFPTLGQGGSAAAMVSEIKKMMGDAVDGDQYQWSLKPGESWTTIERRPEWQQKFSVDGQEVARRLQIMGNLVGLSRAINLQKIDDSLFYIFPA